MRSHLMMSFTLPYFFEYELLGIYIKSFMTFGVMAKYIYKSFDLIKALAFTSFRIKEYIVRH